MTGFFVLTLGSPTSRSCTFLILFHVDSTFSLLFTPKPASFFANARCGQHDPYLVTGARATTEAAQCASASIAGRERLSFGDEEPGTSRGAAASG